MWASVSLLSAIVQPDFGLTWCLDYVDKEALEKVYGKGTTAKDYPHLWSIFHSSRDTVQEVRLGDLNYADRPDKSHPDLPLWSTHFPRLRALHLGEVDFTNPKELVPFLNDHPTIEVLSFENVCDYDYAEEYDLKKTPIGPDTLPNLKTFRGHMVILVALMKAGLRSMKDWTRIQTRPSMEIEHPLSLDEQLKLTPLPSVKALQIDFTPFDSSDGFERSDILDWLNTWSKHFSSSLEVWLGTQTPCPIQSKRLGYAFSKFPNLRVIHICECSAWPDSKEYDGEHWCEEKGVKGEDMKAYVCQLVGWNRKLERVVIHRHGNGKDRRGESDDEAGSDVQSDPGSDSEGNSNAEENGENKRKVKPKRWIVDIDQALNPDGKTMRMNVLFSDTPPKKAKEGPIRGGADIGDIGGPFLSDDDEDFGFE